jgi:hypothetical protein
MFRITIDSPRGATRPAASGGTQGDVHASARAGGLAPALAGVSSATASASPSLRPVSPNDLDGRVRRITLGPRSAPFCVQKAKEASQKYCDVMRTQDSENAEVLTAKAHVEVLHHNSLQRRDARAHLIRPRSQSVVRATPFAEDILMPTLSAHSANYERAIEMRFRTWRQPGNFVYRVVTESTLERYRKEGAIRTRYAGDPLLRHTYFGQYHGRSPEEHCRMLQMPSPLPGGERLIVLKVPAMALLGMRCPRGEYGSALLGRELFTHSYAEFGEGGVAQVEAYTATFSEDWIIPWEESGGTREFGLASA